ncbi:hypothetical protein [Parerythrobacter aestuarii]|uniref:hypothetical protein n=1 Tax=Parerythrobacter aestuarii TaxID=3020909 RepID=UPI0024DEA92A|nr:hypothetical protein [Parerythrobacter aestuarii]
MAHVPTNEAAKGEIQHGSDETNELLRQVVQVLKSIDSRLAEIGENTHETAFRL